MTNASKAITVGGWALLSCLVAGCSGGGDAEAPKAPVVLNEYGYISVEESESDPGYCGYREFGRDERGTKIVEEERYYYSVMNRLLDEDSGLRDYRGLSRVTSCDEARLFTKFNNEYLDTRPAGEGVEDKAALLANFPIGEPETDPVEKILGGAEDPRKEVLGFEFEKRSDFTGELRSRYCSAVRLSGTMFLTAAHCLFIVEPQTTPPNGVISFPAATLKRITGDNNPLGAFYVTDPSRCTNLKPGQPCIVLQMDGYVNQNYTGIDDYHNDLAVVHVRSISQRGLRSAADANADFNQFSARFSTNTPKIGDSVETAGWGPNGVNNDGTDSTKWPVRTAVNLPVDDVFSTTEPKVNGVHRGMYFTTKAKSGAQICLGDSGGPTYNTRNQVMGVLSLSKPGTDISNPDCAAVFANQYFTRTDWQVYSFIPQAMQVLQNGDDTSKCRCVRILAAPGVTDPEAPGAAMRCNEGCTNPAEFTE